MKLLDPQIKYKLNFELNRKKFHLFGILYPILYIFISKNLMLGITLVACLITIYLDIAKHSSYKIGTLLRKKFLPIMRQEELNKGIINFSGATYMALGVFSTCLFFNKNLAITALFILIISDTLAALIGIIYGAHNINNKSFEGSLGFFISSILISSFCYFSLRFETSFLIIILSSFGAACAELYARNLKMNDNFLIPITYCLITISLNILL